MPANIIRGGTDAVTDQIINALGVYKQDHPRATIDLYRQNSVAVRVRVVDPGFDGLTVRERINKVWHYFRDLPDEVQEDVTVLLALTPDEVPKSYANQDFEDPIPSDL